MLLKTIFCAEEQRETNHELSASPTGEIVATCAGHDHPCGRALKFPAGLTREAFDEMVALHRTQNEGQVTQESVNTALAIFADVAAPQE